MVAMDRRDEDVSEPNTRLGVRVGTVMCLLLSLAALALWSWGVSMVGGAPPPGVEREVETGHARAAIVDGASVQASPKGSEPEAIPRTAGNVGGVPYGLPQVPFALIGRVVDPRGNPIANAVVTGTPGPWYDVIKPTILDKNHMNEIRERARSVQLLRVRGVTDADGRFRIGVAGPSEQIDLHVQARGWVPLQRTVPRPSKVDRDLGILKLVRGGGVVGRIVDRTGQPVVAALVSRVDQKKARVGGLVSPDTEAYRELQLGDDVISDDRGAFELPGISSGPFSLRVRHPKYPPAWLEGLTVEEGGVLLGVLVVLDSGAMINGCVTGAPLGVQMHALAALSPFEWANETRVYDRQELSAAGLPAVRGPAARAGGDPRSGGGRAGARGARADRGGGRSVGVPGAAGCGRGRCCRGPRCGVTVWGEAAVPGRSRRGSSVLARRSAAGRGGMGPGIGACGRLRPG
jgi:hypothetical protein